VRAIARGRVAYVNRVAGNSNYGKYVVIAHWDPFGTVFSLYAHLSEVDPAVQPGQDVATGAPIGTMGNTSSTGIPMERAHLHLEIDLLCNANFHVWYRAQHLTPDHGDFNGQNFVGVDPLAFYSAQRMDPKLHFGAFLKTVPQAFQVVLKVPKQIDFFRRYAGLWHGAQPTGTVVIACSANGLPLDGRPADAGEAERLGRERVLIQNVDDAALGRNGPHLISRSSGEWEITPSGMRWLETLTYDPASARLATAVMEAKAKPGNDTRRGTRTKRGAARR
jgi:hypothetical protein